MTPSNEIRQQFLDFFTEKHGHTFAPSSSVVPHGDPTLLFANAGMNQFKDVFLGTGSRPYKRAVNTQKCIRAGGKHNDLDDVGKDTYHHTFFEMLGNWSFGDYFKKEAITWAWELLTDVWKMDPSRLHVTVFEGDPEADVPEDTEAADIWHKDAGVPRERIHLGNKKDNFWEMGDTGPCGPCTEIHIDRTPDKSGASLVNGDSEQVIEIWNLVFIQFNRNPDGSLTPLPAKHVDTGMGFERVAAVIQGKSSNYDTDVFTPIFDAIQKLTKAAKYGGDMKSMTDTAYRVIADHIRMLTFSLSDGAEFGNKDRGYVVRSVLRRAERYGRQYLGTKEPFLHELVPTVVEHMGGVFPELKDGPRKVMDVILDEEKSFIRTYEKGTRTFNQIVEREKAKNSTVIPGKDVFDLHQEQGFFSDITLQMALEEGMTIDEEEFRRLWDIHTTISDGNKKKMVISAVSGDLPETDDKSKFTGLTCDAKVVGYVEDNTVHTDGEVPAGRDVALLLDRTPFYAEQGGQVGDTGVFRTKDAEFTITDTQRVGPSVVHVGRVNKGTIQVSDSGEAKVTGRRADTMRNHTATHLMNLALREVLGDHVEQRGSLVDADRTRFDFTHPEPLTGEQLRDIEGRVNAVIGRDLPVTPIEMPLDEAKKLPGVRAVFGEKYPDPVRVVMVGANAPAEVKADMSVEFCGGTHLNRTGEAMAFKIVSQESVSKGVRRVTAVTGGTALTEFLKRSAVTDSLASEFGSKPEEVGDRVEALRAELKKLQAQLKKAASADIAGTVDKLYADAETFGETKLIAGELPAGQIESVRTQMDRLRQKAKSAMIVFVWDDDGKPKLLVALTDDLVKRGLKAGDLIRPIAEVLGGKGGGRPDMAQAGGKDASKIGEAVAKAKELGAAALAG